MGGRLHSNSFYKKLITHIWGLIQKLLKTCQGKKKRSCLQKAPKVTELPFLKIAPTVVKVAIKMEYYNLFFCNNGFLILKEA